MVKIIGGKSFEAIDSADAENNSIFLDSNDNQLKLKDNNGESITIKNYPRTIITNTTEITTTQLNIDVSNLLDNENDSIRIIINGYQHTKEGLELKINNSYMDSDNNFCIRYCNGSQLNCHSDSDARVIFNMGDNALNVFQIIIDVNKVKGNSNEVGALGFIWHISSANNPTFGGRAMFTNKNFGSITSISLNSYSADVTYYGYKIIKN